MRVKVKEIIETFKETGSVSLTAQLLDIHRSTVYRWLKRGQSLYTPGYLKWKGIKRRSTKPNKVQYALSLQEELAIAKLRKQRGYTAEKIKAKLNLKVSPRTVHRFLKRKGFVREYSYYRRPRFQETVHMHAKNVSSIGYLQMDVKYITPELSGLPWTCFEYAVMDIFSRYKEAVILNQLDQDGAMVAFLEIMPRLPFKPVFIQTDNGLEFLGRFHQLVIQTGLKHHYIHKSTPNENAVIERSFRTDEEEFFFRLEKPPRHYDELRNWFADYLHEYNYERPHLGINLKTPYEVVAEVVSD